jgi:hypothetical protein
VVLAAASVAGPILLIVADFTTLFHVKTVTVVIDSTKGGSHHAYAFVLIGVAALGLAYGAVRSANRPSMAGLLALGVVAALIVLGVDLPDVGREGVVGERYAEAKASPQVGFYLETLGAVLLIVAGGGGLLLTRPAREQSSAERERDTAARAEAAARRAEARARRGRG